VDVKRGGASFYKGATVSHFRGTLILSPLSFSVNCSGHAQMVRDRRIGMSLLCYCQLYLES